MNATSHFHRKLLAKLEAEINRAASDLADGSATSYDQYQFQTGWIAGLKIAASLCEEVERDMDT